MSIPPRSHPSTSHAAEAVWHTPELLTSILHHLDASPSTDRNFEWTPDVARILRTSKYGLEVGAGVLYESQAAFPAGVENSRFDMRDYLVKQNCSETRTKFYCSKVKYLTVPGRTGGAITEAGLRPVDTTSADISLFFRQLIDTYPSAKYIQILSDIALINVVFDPLINRMSHLIVEVYYSGRSTPASYIPTTLAQISDQLINSDGTRPPVSDIRVQQRRGQDTDWFLDMVRDYTPFFGFTPQGDTYAQMQRFDASEGVHLDWKCLKELLDRSPILRILKVEIHLGVGENLVDTFEGKSYANIITADLNLRDHSGEEILSCLELFPGVVELKVEHYSPGRLSADGDWHDDPPYESQWSRSPESLINVAPLEHIRQLDLVGMTLSSRLVLDLLRYCPHLAGFKVLCDTITDTEGLALLTQIAEACPLLLSIGVVPREDFFPFIASIDLLVSALPRLCQVVISANFPRVTIIDRSDWTSSTGGIRWPQLKLLMLLFRGDYQISGKVAPQRIQPIPESVAELLHGCFGEETILRAFDTYPTEESSTWQRRKYTIKRHGAQWWNDVQWSLSDLRHTSYIENKLQWTLLEIEGEGGGTERFWSYHKAGEEPKLRV